MRPFRASVVAMFIFVASSASAQRQVVTARKFPAFSLELPAGWRLKVEESGIDRYPDLVYVFDGPDDYVNLNGTFKLIGQEPETSFEALKSQYLTDLSGAIPDGYLENSFAETTIAGKRAFSYRFLVQSSGSPQIEQRYIIYVGGEVLSFKVYYAQGDTVKAATWTALVNSLKFE
jgi:hypothetical protein